LILFFFFLYLFDYLPAGRPFRNGKEIAGLLIAEARKDNCIASLSIISENVCVQPDGTGPYSNVDRFFLKVPVAYTETDRSEGVWFVYIQHNDQVYIYGIPQRVLRWGSILEEPSTPLDQGEMCPQQIVITDAGDTPSVVRFREK
jgi:hypothetical protein